MNKHLRARINQANAQKSTGPRTAEGKERSKMSAFKHGLSGNHLALQPHEYSAYHQRADAMLADLRPQTEPERQIAQKIIDLNFRLNRVSAIENNMLNFETRRRTDKTTEDERVATMIGQAEAWKKDAHAFDLLGRYEARLSKQLLQYQKEFERLQTVRKAEAQEHASSVALSAQPTQTTPVTPELASFGKPVPNYVMSAVPAAISIPETARQPLPGGPNPQEASF